jgi:hypothetical protein
MPTKSDDWMAGMTDFQRETFASMQSRAESCEARFESLHLDEIDWKAERKRLRAELTAMREQRDEARRDACAFQGIIKFDLQHPKGIISTEATLRLANEIAVERGWDCFSQKEGGGA